MKGSCTISFDDIVTLNNVYDAWIDFSTGKKKRRDLQAFALRIEDELLELTEHLQTNAYQHGGYERFVVHDPVRRVIHKATVRDRVVHRLLYNALLPPFHRRWMDCSYSCRPGFGQHKSIASFERMLRQATQNGTRDVWVLKCDVRKFFDSINHRILMERLSFCISDHRIIELLRHVVDSYETRMGYGLPIGNLTSQMFANVYLHELDRFAKHILRCRWYARYADDAVFLCLSQKEAANILGSVADYLKDELFLYLHPNKIVLREDAWGADWLGRVLMPGYQVLRPSTRRRMMRRVDQVVFNGDAACLDAVLASYNGLLVGTARRSIDSELLQARGYLRV